MRKRKGSKQYDDDEEGGTMLLPLDNLGNNPKDEDKHSYDETKLSNSDSNDNNGNNDNSDNKSRKSNHYV